MKKLTILDSTLRDGAQGEGISFSVQDKLNIVGALDRLGVSYIEAGNPGSNPKDIEFFRSAANLKLKNAKLAAFGSTRRKETSVTEDETMKSILSAGTDVAVIFGKSWDLHVFKILNTTLEENLSMISDTVAYLKSKGKEVIYDAEHFFDGYKADGDYALKTLRAARNAGADVIVLCDTNGGTFPGEILKITKKVVDEIGGDVGIHCHDDIGCGIANSLMAVDAGAVHIQGTFLGYGERCGNANLSGIIPSLQLKEGYECIPAENLGELTTVARYISDVTNIALPGGMPYVGNSAFAHKAGMHADGVSKVSHSFEHISPEAVGNKRRFLTSEMAGRTAILSKVAAVAPNLEKDSKELKSIVAKLKELEFEGWQFEAADASFELVIRKLLGKYRPFFELIQFKTSGEKPAIDNHNAMATIKISVDGKTEITAEEGDGPVHALDKALRKALYVFYPNVAKVRLTDYKVRVLDSQSATAAKVRVLITSTDGESQWSTVGVSTDIIEASWLALVDSIEYKLIKDIEDRFKNIF